MQQRPPDIDWHAWAVVPAPNRVCEEPPAIGETKCDLKEWRGAWMLVDEHDRARPQELTADAHGHEHVWRRVQAIGCYEKIKSVVRGRGNTLKTGLNIDVEQSVLNKGILDGEALLGSKQEYFRNICKEVD